MLLSKDELLAELKLKTEDVALGNGHVRVSEIGAAEYIDLLNDPSCIKEDGTFDSSRFMPLVLSRAIVDSDGNRLFTNSEIALLEKSAQEPFKALVDAAKRVNGLTGEESKNYEAGQIKSFCTDCACTSDTDIQTL